MHRPARQGVIFAVVLLSDYNPKSAGPEHGGKSRPEGEQEPGMGRWHGGQAGGDTSVCVLQLSCSGGGDAALLGALFPVLLLCRVSVGKGSVVTALCLRFHQPLKQKEVGGDLPARGCENK